MFVLILAGVVLGWVVAGLLGPSNQQIRDVAEAALPEGAILNRQWEKVSSPLISRPVLRGRGVRDAAGGRRPRLAARDRRCPRIELTAQGNNGPEGGASGHISVKVDPVAMRHRQEAGALVGAVGLPILVAVVRARRRP